MIDAMFERVNPPLPSSHYAASSHQAKQLGNFLSHITFRSRVSADPHAFTRRPYRGTSFATFQ